MTSNKNSSVFFSCLSRGWNDLDFGSEIKWSEILVQFSLNDEIEKIQTFNLEKIQ